MATYGRKSTAENVTEGLDLSGKTAVVTGVNSGIGQETMRVLALRGAHVIGTARTLDKATQACTAVSGETTPLACELTDKQSVRNCAAAIREMGNPIDLLIANAGIMMVPKLKQADGIELQFATNHLGHFLLVNLLKDRVEAAEMARIVVVSSSGHRQASAIAFDNLSGELGYSAIRAYGQSKLANVLFVLELSKRLENGVTANALHPGIIQTNLGRHINPFLKVLLAPFFFPFSKTVAQGAATQVYVATRPELEGVTGKYFSDCNEERPSTAALDDNAATRLWEVSVELVGL
ncbi:MAG: SDR family NAD(P)-dependent oxidoreductase [Gammaproteobacteria bacterium]|nr:SDR family NAD(P)-dependent oxidoreductase [Gammaproteobacteria bacterium]